MLVGILNFWHMTSRSSQVSMTARCTTTWIKIKMMEPDTLKSNPPQKKCKCSWCTFVYFLFSRYVHPFFIFHKKQESSFVGSQRSSSSLLFGIWKLSWSKQYPYAGRHCPQRIITCCSTLWCRCACVGHIFVSSRNYRTATVHGVIIKIIIYNLVFLSIPFSYFF